MSLLFSPLYSRRPALYPGLPGQLLSARHTAGHGHGVTMPRGCRREGSPVQVEGSDLCVVPLVIGEIEEVRRCLLLPHLPGENGTKQKFIKEKSSQWKGACGSYQLRGADCRIPKDSGNKSLNVVIVKN